VVAVIGGQPAQASPQQLAAQVARHVGALRTLGDGTRRTVMHLSPEHLGELTLTVDVRNGSVQLAMTGGEAAIATLREGIGLLRDQLADSGLDLGTVSLRDNATDSGRGHRQAPATGGGEGNPQGRPGGRAAERPAGPPEGRPRTGEDDTVRRADRVIPGVSRIDVRI